MHLSKSRCTVPGPTKEPSTQSTTVQNAGSFVPTLLHFNIGTLKVRIPMRDLQAAQMAPDRGVHVYEYAVALAGVKEPGGTWRSRGCDTVTDDDNAAFAAKVDGLFKAVRAGRKSYGASRLTTRIDGASHGCIAGRHPGRIGTEVTHIKQRDLDQRPLRTGCGPVGYFGRIDAGVIASAAGPRRSDLLFKLPSRPCRPGRVRGRASSRSAD